MNRNSFRVPTSQPGSRMPQYNPQQLPATPGADVSARLSDSAGQIISQGADQQAKGLEMLGRGMQQAAKAGYDLYGDYQTTKAKEAWLTYRQEADALKAELNTLVGKQAIDEKGGVQARIAQWKQEARTRIAQNLGGPASAMFERAASDVDGSLANWGVGKAHGEGVNYGNEQSTALIQLRKDEALANADNPEALTTALRAIDDEIANNMAPRNGWDETIVKAKQQKLKQETLVQAVSDRIKSEQLGKANVLIGAWRSDLGGHADSLRAQAAAKGRELQARARADAERAETDANKRALDSFLADTVGMAPEDQLATVKERFGNNQKMYLAALDAVTFRDGASKAIRGKEQEIRLNAKADKIAEIASLSPQESLAKFNELSAALPVEDRKKAYEMYDNAVKATGPGARPTDHPGAKEDVLARMAAGEEFNVWTEYGGLLSPRTLKELSDKQVRSAMPGIKNDFDMRAMEWLGEKKNKSLAGDVLGSESLRAMWVAYYDNLTPEDRRNPVAMRDKVDRFFKATLLNSGRIFDSNKSIPMGLQPRYLKSNPGWFPQKGQQEYEDVIARLQSEGIKPEGVAGKYSDAQIARMYKSLLESQK